MVNPTVAIGNTIDPSVVITNTMPITNIMVETPNLGVSTRGSCHTGRGYGEWNPVAEYGK